MCETEGARLMRLTPNRVHYEFVPREKDAEPKPKRRWYAINWSFIAGYWTALIINIISDLIWGA